MFTPAAAPAEKLADRFRESSFDLVHARNCLDHAFDPAAAIGQMLQVVRPGLCVFLEHVVNEGEKEGYRGLHQWNFFRDGRDFCVSGRKGKRNLTRELADRAEVECSVGEDDWVRARLRKR